MADIRSALEESLVPGRYGDGDGSPPVTLSQITGLDIVQIATWPDRFILFRKTLMADFEITLPFKGRTFDSELGLTSLMIAPQQYWLIAPQEQEITANLRQHFNPSEAVVTDLSHARTIISLSGNKAATLLNRGIPVDLHPDKFPPGDFVQTAFHKFSVLLLHTKKKGHYHCYVPRSFAISFWQELTIAAAPFGYSVKV